MIRKKKKKLKPEIKSCGVISEIAIKKVIRLRLAIVVEFIGDMVGNDLLFI
jgi:hypothetical protein